MSLSLRFIGFYITLVAVTSGLMYTAITSPVIAESLVGFWGVWIMGLAWSFTMIGVGFALPVAIITLCLAWGQVYLLSLGAIKPHLADDGFAQAIKTIITEIINLRR